jgi:hypothetical protein
MSKYVKMIVVHECYHSCPFFNSVGQEMQCDHPFYLDKSNLKTAYDNMIITQQNSRGRVPDACPLKKELSTSVETVVDLGYAARTQE